jgi:hypothetical protein
MRRRLWPVTVVPARYGGCYEGASWVAFPCRYHDIPINPYDDDISAMEWWGSSNADMVGRGESPAEALDDLDRRCTYKQHRSGGTAFLSVEDVARWNAGEAQR